MCCRTGRVGNRRLQQVHKQFATWSTRRRYPTGEAMRSLFNVPAHADPTLYRRSRALNILTILTGGIVGLLALIIVLTTHDAGIVLFALISYLIFGTPYLINRTGRVDLA